MGGSTVMHEADSNEHTGLLPMTSVAASAHRRLVCPVHGLLDGLSLRCPECNKAGYDLSNDDEWNILRSLRRVENSARLSRARVFGFPIALLALITLLGFGAPTYVVAIFFGEACSRGIARLLRQKDPPRIRSVDKELGV
jgi:hypothetical protein